MLVQLCVSINNAEKYFRSRNSLLRAISLFFSHAADGTNRSVTSSDRYCPQQAPNAAWQVIIASNNI